MATLIPFVPGVLTPWTESMCPFATVADKNLVGITSHLQEPLVL